MRETPPGPARFLPEKSTSLTGLFALACLYTLYFARHLLIPVVIAVLASLLLLPIVRGLKRKWRFPEPLSAALLMSAALGFLIASVFFVAEPASNWLQAIPSRLPELEYRLKNLKRPIEKVAEASAKVQALADVAPQKKKSVVTEPASSAVQDLLVQTPFFLAGLLSVFVLVFFILASGDALLRNLVGALPQYQDKKKWVEIARTLENHVAAYLQAITAINVGLGVVVALAAFFCGLENYILWGVMACILNYIPYLGALVGIVILAVIGLLSFDSLSQALAMPALYLACTTLEGNFITPSVLGRFMTLNPLAVFLAVLFWGWIWGLAGVFLAVPLLAVFKILCDHTPSLRPLGTVLGGKAAEAAGLRGPPRSC